MESFNNSYRAKEAVEKKTKPRTEKVVKGEVKTKEAKRSFFKEFFAKDVGEIKEYMIFDVLMPKTKDVLFDFIDNAASMIIFGDGRKGKSKASNTYVSYNNYSSDKKSSGASIMQRRSDIIDKDVIFDRPEDAEEVLSGLMDILETYDFVSVGDYYQLVGTETTERDFKYGWKNLGSAKRERVRDGYILSLPKPVYLD